MARLNLEPATISLEDLIPKYYEDKSSMDTLKKVCDAENSQIKDLLREQGIDTYEANGYKAKRTVSCRESLNEERLLEVIRKHGIEGVIKTKEYVDMDELESYLYNHESTTELATDLASCKTTTEVVQLRVTKAKKKEED
jgi:hypothetical protein